MNFKLILLKSIIYRVLTIILGFSVVYIITGGDLVAALSTASITEAVQALNYFAFETIWSRFYERYVRAQMSKEFRQKEIQLKLTTGMIGDISREFAEIDTFNPVIYNSLKQFFEKALANEELEEYHPEILEAKKNFEAINRDRGFEEF